jgi:hypothetical protein
MIIEHYWNDNDKGKPKYLEKTCPSATFSTANPTQTNLGSNQTLRSEDLTTDL